VITTLSAIFKNKFKKYLAPILIYSPIKATENKRRAALVQPIITSPTKNNYQTRSQKEVKQAPANVIKSKNSPQFPRVFTPAVKSAAPPRVTARTRNLSPRNLSQGDFLDMGSANHSMASANPSVPMMNTVLHLYTGKEMQYTDLMKHLLFGP
jgi:hypothetical protein